MSDPVSGLRLQPLSLQVAHTAGDKSSSFVLAFLLAVGGVVVAMNRASLLPLAATACALAWIVWLFRAQPKAVQFEYMVIDESGVRYLHTPWTAGRVSMYSWDEVQDVSAKLMSHGEDVQGLSILTNRAHLGGVRVLLPVFNEADCIEAFEAASRWMASSASARQLLTNADATSKHAIDPR